MVRPFRLLWIAHAPISDLIQLVETTFDSEFTLELLELVTLTIEHAFINLATMVVLVHFLLDRAHRAQSDPIRADIARTKQTVMLLVRHEVN